MMPSVGVLDGSISGLLPNVLGTRTIASQLVTTDGATAIGFFEESGRLAPLVGYGIVAGTVGVLLTRWQLYDRGMRS